MDDNEHAPLWDHEAVYDEQISPLMRQILEICKAHNLPMFATFQYRSSEHPEEMGLCTSKLVPELPGVEQDLLQNLDRVARRGWGVHPQSFAMTITTRKQG
jgi:hypothetical protein